MKATNLTEEQTKHEIKKIKTNNLTLEEYIRLSRAGEKFKMNRKDRKEVYSIYVYNKYFEPTKRKVFGGVLKTFSKKRTAGSIAYDAICKYRDEVMLLSA